MHHKKCSGLNNEAFKKLALEVKRTGVTKQYCNSCVLEVSIIELDDEDIDDDKNTAPSITAIMKGMEALLLKHLEPVKQELRDSRDNMMVLDTKIKALKVSNVDIKKMSDKNCKSMVDLEKRVTKLKMINPDINKVFRETKHRKRRDSCVIGYNIPESDEYRG